MRNNIKYIILSISGLLNSCHYCTLNEAEESLTESYTSNVKDFNAIPLFMKTNEDSISVIWYYDYDYNIGFKSENKKRIVLKIDSIHSGLTKNGLMNITSIERLLFLMKNEKLESIHYNNGVTRISNFCSSNLKDGKIYLIHSFENYQDNSKTIKEINENWSIKNK